MRQLPIIILLGLTVLPAIAHAQAADEEQEPQLESAVARRALLQYDIEIERAEEAYQKALESAQRRLLRDLKLARLGAERARNEDDVKAIDAKISEIEFYLAAKEIVVQANEAWQEAGELKEGESVRITARASWRTPAKGYIGANGQSSAIFNGFPDRSLIGRIGDGKSFFVGEELELVVDRPGMLYLRMNCYHLNRAHLNKGAAKVRISASPPAPDAAKVPDEVTETGR